MKTKKKQLFLFSLLIYCFLFFLPNLVKAQVLYVIELSNFRFLEVGSEGECAPTNQPLPTITINGKEMPWLTADENGSRPFCWFFDIINRTEIKQTFIPDESLPYGNYKLLESFYDKDGFRYNYYPYVVLSDKTPVEIAASSIFFDYYIKVQIPSDRICLGKVNDVKNISQGKYGDEIYYQLIGLPSDYCSELFNYLKIDYYYFFYVDENGNEYEFLGDTGADTEIIDSKGQTHKVWTGADDVIDTYIDYASRTYNYVNGQFIPYVEYPHIFKCPYNAPQNYSTSKCPYVFHLNNKRYISALPAHIARLNPAISEQYGFAIALTNSSTIPINTMYELKLLDEGPEVDQRYNESYLQEIIKKRVSSISICLATGTLDLGPLSSTILKIKTSDCPGYKIRKESNFFLTVYHPNYTNPIKLMDYYRTNCNLTSSATSTTISFFYRPKNLELLSYWDTKITGSLNKNYYSPGETAKLYVGTSVSDAAKRYGWLIIDFKSYSLPLPAGSRLFLDWYYIWPDKPQEFVGSAIFTTSQDLRPGTYLNTWPDRETYCRMIYPSEYNKCMDATTIDGFLPYDRRSYAGEFYKLGDISVQLPSDELPDAIKVCAKLYLPQSYPFWDEYYILEYGWSPSGFCNSFSFTPLLVVNTPKEIAQVCISPIINFDIKDNKFYYQVQCSGLKYNNETPTISKIYMTRFIFADSVERVIKQYASSLLLSSVPNQLKATTLLVQGNTTSSEQRLFYRVSLDPSTDVTPTAVSSIQFESVPQFGVNDASSTTYIHQFACDMDGDGYWAEYCCEIADASQKAAHCQPEYDCNDADSRIHPGADPWQDEGIYGPYSPDPCSNDEFKTTKWDCQNTPSCVKLKVINLDSKYNPCHNSRIPTIVWQVTDENGEPVETTYHYNLKICSDDQCNSSIYELDTESEKVGPFTGDGYWVADSICTRNCCEEYESEIEWGHEYYVQVKVKPSGTPGEGIEVSWSEPATISFTTPPFCWPTVDFTCNSQDCEKIKLFVNAPVTLKDQTKYIEGREYTCHWSFEPSLINFVTEIITKPDGSISTHIYTADECTTKVKFTEDTEYQVTLTITDTEDSDITCSSQPKDLNIQFLALPKYKEVPPLRSTFNFLEKSLASLVNVFDHFLSWRRK